MQASEVDETLLNDGYRNPPTGAVYTLAQFVKHQLKARQRNQVKAQAEMKAVKSLLNLTQPISLAAACHRGDGLSNDHRGGFEAVGCWRGLDLAFGHDGGRATGFAVFVYLAIHDFHALKIFLDDFFPGEFDVLFRLSACPLANPVDHVLFHQNPNLFGQDRCGQRVPTPAGR